MSSNNQIGRIMIEQESLFKSQVRELHALYQKQLELTDAYKATMIGPTQEQFVSAGKLVKNTNYDLEETSNTCEVAKELDVIPSSPLRGSSGCLHWFVNVVASVEADMKTGQSPVEFKESRRRHVVNWGRIKKGKRSRRVRSD